MVVFDELRITEDGQYLIIDARIRKDITTEGCKITSIWVCDSSEYKEGIPSDTNPIGVKVYDYEDSEDNLPRRVYKKIDPRYYDNLPSSFKGKLLFVYANVFMPDEIDAPCGCYSNPSVGVTLDMSIIYNQFMKYINDLCSNSDSCSSNVSSGLTDFILRYNSFLLAIDSKHYRKGIEFFNKWFSSDSKMVTHNCGCHG